MSMIRPLVLETATAPGTAITCNLNGPQTGYRSFIAAFGAGVSLYYFLYAAPDWEYGVGTITAGSPNVLNRTTVILNSLGTNARINFTGTVDVYNAGPGERLVHIDNASRVTIGSAAAPHTLDIVGTAQFGSGGATDGMVSIYTTGVTGASIEVTQRGNTAAKGSFLLQHFGGNVFSNGIAADTTASAANMVISSVDGRMQRSTSSGEFKTDIEDLDEAVALRVAELARPVWYRSLSPADNPRHSHYGLIAEEIAAIDPRLVSWRPLPAGEAPREGVPHHRAVITEWVQEWGEDGAPVTRQVEREAVLVPAGVAYDRVLLVARRGDEIRVARRLAEIEARIAALEAR